MENSEPKVVVYGRASLTDLAAIARYYVERGNLPKSRGGLLSQVVRDMASMVLAMQLVEGFPDYLTANAYLMSIGLGPKSTRERASQFVQDVTGKEAE